MNLNKIVLSYNGYALPESLTYFMKSISILCSETLEKIDF